MEYLEKDEEEKPYNFFPHKWKPLSDERFASQFFAQVDQAQTASFHPRTTLLCDRCQQIQLPIPYSILSFNTPEMQTTSQSCQLCAMILQHFGSSKHIECYVGFRRLFEAEFVLENCSQSSLITVAVPG